MAKQRTMKGPDPSSKTTKKRANRNWKSLEQSSRIHRRALRRLGSACVIQGKQYPPGEKVAVNKSEFTAGGALKYY